jgi:hypothetical protein
MSELPGGGGSKPRKAPFKSADPVEEGWNSRDWYRAYNAANSRLRAKEGQAVALAARISGRTREEAKGRKDFYNTSTGNSLGSLPPHKAPMIDY